MLLNLKTIFLQPGDLLNWMFIPWFLLKAWCSEGSGIMVARDQQSEIPLELF